jgi:cytoskeletal protein CcmA (bactofilin family)
MTLEGTLVFEGTMIINGHVKGTIESKEGTIIIGDQAVIHADVYVRHAKVSGEIRGIVKASDQIELHPPARVYGDLTAPVVLIDAGVTFDGKCTTAPKDGSTGKIDDVLKKLPEGVAKDMPSGKKTGSSEAPNADESGAEATA